MNPSAPSFDMPSGNGSAMSNTTTTDSAPNGQSKQPKQKRPEAKTTTTAENIAEAGAGAKLTGSQLKKQKAAEKAARRAEKVADRGAQAQEEPSAPGQQPGPVQAREGQERQRRMSSAVANNRDSAEGQNNRQGGSSTARLPIRGSQQQQQQGEKSAPVAKGKVVDRRVPMLSHLYTASSGLGRRASLATADRQIHPAVLTLGLQLRDYVICGSNARTVATMLVFKKVIRSYDTPSGVALSRDLTRHLSHQINYLSHARPLCMGQGNSIRWLKKLITALDLDLADTEAKSFLCRAIDSFIREKITLADEVIATQATDRMEDEGEVILTYGKSSVVERTLLTAFESGKKFKVVVVDSRPLFEGKNLARSLLRAGLQDVKYCLLNGLADVVEQEGVTKCFLGASAMLGNGRMSARAGSAMVAMMAKECSGGAVGRGKVPVIVLAESIKFTSKVALDSLSINEVADPEMLVEPEERDTLIETPVPQSKPETQPKRGGRSGDGGGDDESDRKEKRGLQGWKEQTGLYLVNLMYDVTPTEYLDVVITELGSLPPNAVPVVNGVHGGDE